MTLIGRHAELRDLATLAQTHTQIVLVGLPGVGRRALARAFVKAEKGWSLESGEQQIHVSTRVDVASEAVHYQVRPLSPDSAQAFFTQQLARLDARQSDPNEPFQEDMSAFVALLEGFPRALQLAARLCVGTPMAWAHARLTEQPIWTLLADDPQAMEWQAALKAEVEALPSDVQGLLEMLSLFEAEFDEEAVEAVSPQGFAAFGTLIQNQMLTPGPPWTLPACIRWTARQSRSPDAQARYQSHVLTFTADHKRSPMYRADLRAIFEGPDVQAARQAGARMVPFVIDEGPIEPHLRALLLLRDPESADTETECALAQMQILIGEPEAAWRRLSDILPNAGAFLGRAEHLSGNAHRRLSDHPRACLHYSSAIEWFERTGARGELGMALCNLGGALVEQGRRDNARRTWARALRCFALEKDTRSEAITLGDLGLLDHEDGQFDRAERRYRRALELHETLGNTRYIGIVQGDLADLELLTGRPLQAKARLMQALVSLEQTGDVRQHLLATAALAFAEALTGDSDSARQRLDRVIDHAPDDLVQVIDLYASALAFGEAKQARHAGDRGREKTLLRSIDAALNSSDNKLDEMRRVKLLVATELQRHRGGGGWAIARNGGFFISPENGRVDLARRRVYQRLVSALVEAALQSGATQDGTVARDALLRAGWPEQRSSTPSARNRLNVALSGLRKLGLGPILETAASGYRLRLTGVDVMDD